LSPLVEIRALSFCEPAACRALTLDTRLAEIYFTGGTLTAQATVSAADTELVSECGGNNPCLIVPGDWPWSKDEIRHQAMPIATMVKINVARSADASRRSSRASTGISAASIIVDDKTRKAHASTAVDAVTRLRYGAIGVNAMPPVISVNPALTWCGNEEDREFVSGRGNFGNLLGYENVEKSIATGGFMSPGRTDL
jgi:hypothetical protein